MKKTVALFLMVIMLSLLSFAAFAADARLRCEASATTLHRGETVTITVSLQNAPSAKSMALRIACGSDFEAVSGTWLRTDAVLADFDPAKNAAALAYANATDMNGKIFELQLKARNTAALGDATITISPVLRMDTDTYDCAAASLTLTVAATASTTDVAPAPQETDKDTPPVETDKDTQPAEADKDKDKDNGTDVSETPKDTQTEGGSTPAPVPADKPDAADSLAKFTDCDAAAWYAAGVRYCVDNGYMVGTTEDTFAPGGAFSRAMIVTMLWRMEGSPTVDYAMSFTDVAQGQWYAEPIRWAQSTGLVKGVSDTEFCPNDNITREQLATIFANYARLKGINVVGGNDLSAFADAAEISAWALDNLRWANAVGLMSGRSETEIAPKGGATRAEAAVIVQRFCENVAK